jgi:peptidoglycan/xylan/chitin deacetylase (PgdA/CDA1 family)
MRPATPDRDVSVRSLARHACYAAARRLGVWTAVRRALCAQRVTILTYHAVVREPLAIPDSCFLDEASFAAQIDYLQRHFDLIPLSAVARRLDDGTRPDRPAIAITFDDGYQNNVEVAWPWLRRAGVPATIFLATDFVGSDDLIWSWRLLRALAGTTVTAVQWEGTTIPLDTTTARRQAMRVLVNSLKRMPQPRLLETMRPLLRALGDDPERPVESGSPFRMIERTAVRELAQSGLIDFGAHTCSHAILSVLSDEEQEHEVRGSLAAVGGLTGRACTLFAYPNGRAEDYSPATVDLLRRCGVTAAVTTIKAPLDRAADPLQLPRLGVRAGITLDEFRVMLDRALLATTAA